MRTAHASGGAADSSPVSRNAPCPCGSGRKAKRCCHRPDGGRRPRRDDASGGADRPPPPLVDSWVLPLTLVLAFCSIVYELLLGQTLSAFLGNTVLRYSVTIGLYMLSMGIGAFLARGRWVARPVISLQWIELLIAIAGGASVVALCWIDALGTPPLALSLLAHAWIVFIGVLSGLEIPLMIALKSGRDDEAASGVLGVDYLGAFLGTVTFAFLFYPVVGLVPTAFAVATLNAIAGLSLAAFRARVADEDRVVHRRLFRAQAALGAALLVALACSAPIREVCLDLYLGDDVRGTDAAGVDDGAGG